MKRSVTKISSDPETPGQCRQQFCLAGESGQSLVELALTLPLFIFILVGATEFGRFAWATIEASSAARAGVQYGAQNHATASMAGAIQAAALNDGVNLTGLSATPSTYCVCSTALSTHIACGGLTGGLIACPSPATLLEYVVVTTTATVTPLAHYPGLPSSFTAQGYAVMEVEQ